ncbi:hypothetical protein JKP88DRAFT_251024 [Tribonema minus]|uniref:Uncharacterized protein n=1 Tax=Tribonema minus TaxID=303371 RepID=A0A836CQS4_9STRA|nr:hypothetical protein JKP88DRAFT_251024 [Tribonema minus]
MVFRVCDMSPQRQLSPRDLDVRLRCRRAQSFARAAVLPSRSRSLEYSRCIVMATECVLRMWSCTRTASAAVPTWPYIDRAVAIAMSVAHTIRISLCADGDRTARIVCCRLVVAMCARRVVVHIGCPGRRFDIVIAAVFSRTRVSSREMGGGKHAQQVISRIFRISASSDKETPNGDLLGALVRAAASRRAASSSAFIRC